MLGESTNFLGTLWKGRHLPARCPGEGELFNFSSSVTGPGLWNYGVSYLLECDSCRLCGCLGSRLRASEILSDPLAHSESKDASLVDRSLARLLEDWHLLGAERIELAGEELAGLHCSSVKSRARSSREHFQAAV